MSSRARLVIAIVAVVLVCLLLYMFVIRPRQSELDEVQTDVETAQAEQVQLQQRLEVLRDLQDRAPDLQAELDEIRGFVPEEAEIPNFIFQVQEAANEAGVEVVQIQPELPKQPPEGGSLAEVRSIVRAQGEYFSIQDFVRRLYDLDRALRIDTMTLGEPGGGAAAGTTGGTTTTGGTSDLPEGQIEINMAARIFFEPPGGVTAGGGTTTTPTPAPTPTDGATPAEGATPGSGTTPAPATTP